MIFKSKITIRRLLDLSENILPESDDEYPIDRKAFYGLVNLTNFRETGFRNRILKNVAILMFIRQQTSFF